MVCFLQFTILAFCQDGKVVITCEPIVIKCIQPTSGNYYINSLKEYNDSITKTSTNSECSNYDLPIIDFEKYSLLGFVTAVGGCDEPEVKYFMVQNEVYNKEEFCIEVNVLGECLRNNIVEIWCLIPKTNYEMKFNINYFYTK